MCPWGQRRVHDASGLVKHDSAIVERSYAWAWIRHVNPNPVGLPRNRDISIDHHGGWRLSTRTCSYVINLYISGIYYTGYRGSGWELDYNGVKVVRQTGVDKEIDPIFGCDTGRSWIRLDCQLSDYS
jgi:hypothetical protein